MRGTVVDAWSGSPHTYFHLNGQSYFNSCHVSVLLFQTRRWQQEKELGGQAAARGVCGLSAPLGVAAARLLLHEKLPSRPGGPLHHLLPGCKTPHTGRFVLVLRHCNWIYVKSNHF